MIFWEFYQKEEAQRPFQWYLQALNSSSSQFHQVELDWASQMIVTPFYQCLFHTLQPIKIKKYTYYQFGKSFSFYCLNGTHKNNLKSKENTCITFGYLEEMSWHCNIILPYNFIFYVKFTITFLPKIRI